MVGPGTVVVVAPDRTVVDVVAWEPPDWVEPPGVLFHGEPAPTGVSGCVVVLAELAATADTGEVVVLADPTTVVDVAAPPLVATFEGFLVLGPNAAGSPRANPTATSAATAAAIEYRVVQPATMRRQTDMTP